MGLKITIELYINRMINFFLLISLNSENIFVQTNIFYVQIELIYYLKYLMYRSSLWSFIAALIDLWFWVNFYYVYSFYNTLQVNSWQDKTIVKQFKY